MLGVHEEHQHPCMSFNITIYLSNTGMIKAVKLFRTLITVEISNVINCSLKSTFRELRKK